MRYIHMAMFLLWGLNSSLLCQSNDSRIYLDSVRKSLDYNQTKWVLQPRSTDDKKDRSKVVEEKDPEYSSSRGGVAAGILAVFIIIFILGLAAILAYLFVPKKRAAHIKKIEANSDEDDEEDIEVIDSDQGLSEALSDGNYRMAIRMHFIKVLQNLSEQNKIKWNPDKTNVQYAKELSGLAIATYFQSASRIYEWVWYGNKKINREEYERMRSLFLTIDRIGYE